MKKILFLTLLCSILNTSCDSSEEVPDTAITGYGLLSNLSGHWVGTNDTAYGVYDWFAFDFRPISSSHVHSIYEGGTNQNIISSVFVADFENKKQIMARNGGWLGSQYRATYFVLDMVDERSDSKYYRLVDAVGKEQRAYMEFRFENDTLYFDAYKDNSGTLGDPIHHMGFKGTNYNPSYAQVATDLFSFPQEDSEVNLENGFDTLEDPDSALFLEENLDPFPKAMHGHISDLTIQFKRDIAIADQRLLLYLSKEPILYDNGVIDFDNLNRTVVRTIDIRNDEEFYKTTYLHPDTYYITAFSDLDNNQIPSAGDYTSLSKSHIVSPESNLSTDLDVNIVLQ